MNHKHKHLKLSMHRDRNISKIFTFTLLKITNVKQKSHYDVTFNMRQYIEVTEHKNDYKSAPCGHTLLVLTHLFPLPNEKVGCLLHC